MRVYHLRFAPMPLQRIDNERSMSCARSLAERVFDAKYGKNLGCPKKDLGFRATTRPERNHHPSDIKNPRPANAERGHPTESLLF